MIKEEINEILLKNIIEKKKNRQIRHTSSNDGQGPPREKSHKWKEQGITSEESELVESSDKGKMIVSSNNNTSKQVEPKTKKRKGFGIELYGEFKKSRPPTFDGELEEGPEAWLLNMGKYFQVYNYPSNLKARLSIFQLNIKITLWWLEAKIVNKIRGKDLTWKI